MAHAPSNHLPHVVIAGGGVAALEALIARPASVDALGMR
jgi:hypothetical protein